MRKVNSTPNPAYDVAEIQNSNLRTKGLKSLEFSADKLDPVYNTFIDYGMPNYNEVANKYEEQDRRVEFNVLLKILGYTYTFDQYLHGNLILPYVKAEGKSMLFIYQNAGNVIAPYELKKKILRDFLKSSSNNDRVIGIKYLDENNEIRFIDEIYVNNANKMIETED